MQDDHLPILARRSDRAQFTLKRRSRRLEESGVAMLEALRVRLGRTAAGYGDGRPVHLLESVLEHWPIDLVEQPLVDPNHEARGDPQEVPIEGGVVDLAQGHSVGHDGLATFLTVTDDVSGV